MTIVAARIAIARLHRSNQRAASRSAAAVRPAGRMLAKNSAICIGVFVDRGNGADDFEEPGPLAIGQDGGEHAVGGRRRARAARSRSRQRLGRSLGTVYDSNLFGWPQPAP